MELLTNKNIDEIQMPENLALAMKVRDFRMKCAKLGCTYDYAHFAFGGSPFPVPEAIQEALKKHSGDGEYLPAVGIEPLESSTFRVASIDYDGEKPLAAYLDDPPKGSVQERAFVESQASRLVLGVVRLRRWVDSL